MKRKVVMLLSLLMILCLLPLESMAVCWGAVVRITSSAAVNVRQKPDAKSRLLGEVQPQNTYPCLDKVGDWYEILYTGDITGYVPAKYVTRETGLVPNHLGGGAPVDAIVRVTHYNALNVRSGPGKKYSTLGSAKPDSTWTFLGTDDGWNIIQYGHEIGYIAANRTEVEVVDGQAGATGAASVDCDVCDNTRVCRTCMGACHVYSAAKQDYVRCPSCDGQGACYACQ